VESGAAGSAARLAQAVESLRESSISMPPTACYNAIRLLADVNIEGHVTRLVSLMQSAYWRDALDVRYQRFRDVGLSASDSDAQVWQFCLAQ
jgi:hypothetical protein